MVGTLPSCATSATLDPESRDSTVVLLLNFGGILQQKVCPAVEYAQLYKNKKNVYKDVSHQACQKYVVLMDFFSVIHQNIQKAWELVGAQACHEIIVFPN